jgi:hypothetical protein
VHERTGRRDMPDIIVPVIMVGAPLTSAVKFGDPSARTAVMEARALWPLSVPENTTEF